MVEVGAAEVKGVSQSDTQVLRDLWNGKLPVLLP